MTTEELLSEDPAEARVREASAFEALAAQAGNRVVLWGAGSLGRKVLAALRSAGAAPLGFADNDPSLQVAGGGGLPVLSLHKAIDRWGPEALYVVTQFRPSGERGMAENLSYLGRLGCRHACPFLPLAWRYPGILPHYGADLPSVLLRNAAELRRVSPLWDDAASSDIFRGQLWWRLRADFSGIGVPQASQYFPRDVLRPSPDERFVDGGAYDGDTLRSLPKGFARAWAIEPDPMNAGRLRAAVDARVSVFETALGARSGRGRFDARGSMASALNDSGGLEITLSALDDLLGDESPTYIKLDVEGSELAALAGARETLRRAQPVTAVCMYHRPQDLWEIPLFLSEALPRHHLALRIHAHDGFELVGYAVPRGRWP